MKHFSWLDDVFLPSAAAGLTVGWLSLWARWLAAVAVPPPAAPAPVFSPALMLALMAASALSARFIVRGLGPAPSDEDARYSRDPGAEARQRILIAGGLSLAAALWLTYGWAFPFGYLRNLLEWDRFVSPEFMMLLVGGLLWWRGLVLGQSRLPYAELEQTFYSGLVALALLLVLNRTEPHLPSTEVLATVLMYFALGLSALTLASVARARRLHRTAIGTRLALNRHWLTTIGGIILSVLLGGLGVMALLAPESVARLRPLFAALDWLAQPLLFAFAWLLGWLARPFFILANWLLRFGFAMFKIPELPPQFQVNEEALKVLDAILNSRAVKLSGRAGVILLIGLLLMVVIAAALRRFRWLAEKNADETRESILSRDLLLKQLRDLLRRRNRPAPAPPAPPYLPLSGAEARARIRRAYQAMLEWAKQKGWPRAAGQTPAQYAEALAQTQPATREALATLTQTYQRARYAADALALDEAQAAEAAMQQIIVNRDA